MKFRKRNFSEILSFICSYIYIIKFSSLFCPENYLCLQYRQGFSYIEFHILRTFVVIEMFYT